MAYGIAGFDSAAIMLMAAARALERKDFPAVGHPRILQQLVRHSEVMPTRLARAVYAAATGFEGVPQSAIGRVRVADIAAWATGLYPQRQYPAAIIGSSCGALVHLAAALNAPWLPQTVLVPVRRKGGGIDDPRGDLEQARAAGETFVARNPEVQLHQMHDPNQDRLSLQYITYFRPKLRRLPPAYREFLTERLAPGATVIVAECTRRWPTTQVGERHLFQFGALGGMEPDEYFSGSERVSAYLARYNVGLAQWSPPPPDGDSPEAEWGFEPALGEEINEIARDRGLRVLRLRFDDPEALSPLVADFHRDWYRRRGIEADRLLVESFVLIEPQWVLRTGSVPFWMTFNTRPSLEALRDYLDQSERFDDIRMMLFPHGTLSVGLPTIEEWRSVFAAARKGGGFVGVNERAFPAHFSALARYHLDVKRIPSRYPLPGPLRIDDLERFIADAGNRYAARLAA